MKKIFFSFFFLSFVFALQTKAQNNSRQAASKKPTSDSLATDTADSKRSLTVEIDYGSNKGYEIQRRTVGSDTSQKYIMPCINYEANSGFFANIGLYKTPGAKKRWDEFYFGLGWDFTISNSADIDGSAGYTHYTYNAAIKQNGVNPASSDLIAYVKHDFDILAVKLTGDYYFGGSNSDEDLIMDIDHAFYIDNLLSKKDELSIDPTVTMVGATSNYAKGIIKVPKDDPNAPPKDQIKSALNAFQFNKFQFAYYEFYLPVNYEIKKFDFEVAWHYSVPSDLLPSNISPAVSSALTPVLNPKPYSYITALVSFDFLKK